MIVRRKPAGRDLILSQRLLVGNHLNVIFGLENGIVGQASLKETCFIPAWRKRYAFLNCSVGN